MKDLWTEAVAESPETLSTVCKPPKTNTVDHEKQLIGENAYGKAVIALTALGL